MIGKNDHQPLLAAQIRTRRRKVALLIAGIAVVGGAASWDLWHGLHQAKLRGLLTRQVFPEKVRVAHGDPIDPDSILVAVDVPAREAFRNGEKASFGEIRKTFTETRNPSAPAWLPRWSPISSTPKPGALKFRKDPVLVEARPGAVFRDCGALFEALLIPGWINISFLVETPDGPRAISLPVPCEGPAIARGGCVRELSAQADIIWVVVKPGPGGQFLVKEIIQGPDRGWMVMEINGKPERQLRSREWPGEHPPFGPWSTEMLRSFLADGKVSVQTPIIVLDVAAGETVSEVLNCLAELQGIAGENVVVEMNPRWP